MKGLIFTYLLTYGGAAAALFNPFIGLLIYVAFAILRPESLWHWSVPEGNYSRIVAIGLLIGWALKGFGRWDFGRARPVVYALLGYMLWMIVSASVNQDRGGAWEFVEASAKIVLPFLAAMTLIRSLDQLQKLAWVIVVCQGYVAYEMNLAYYGGYNILAEQGFAGMDNNCMAIAMVTGAGLAFFLGLGETIRWRQLLAFACAALMTHCVLFSMSRGGMLALIIMGGLSFFLIPKRPAHYLAFALAVALGLRLAGPQVVERFSSTFADENQRDMSEQSRLSLWTSCWDAMLKQPLAGVGPRQWPRIATEYGFTPGKEGHSLWLQTGAEMGFPGLGFLLAFYLVCINRLRVFLRPGAAETAPWSAGVARAVIASLVGFMISAQFVSLPGLELPYYIVIVGAGILKLTATKRVADTEAASDAAADEQSLLAAAGVDGRSAPIISLST